MSDMQQALLISGAIFAVVVLSQCGTREYTWHKIAIPLLAVAGFGYSYLHAAPTSGPDLIVYAAGATIGVLFGIAAAACTGIRRDASTGRILTVSGIGFVAIWFVAMAVRIGFIWSVDNLASFRSQFGSFMFEHNIDMSAIAPFFVIMALTMVVVRVGTLGVRASRSGGGTPDRRSAADQAGGSANPLVKA